MLAQQAPGIARLMLHAEGLQDEFKSATHRVAISRVAADYRGLGGLSTKVCLEKESQRNCSSKNLLLATINRKPQTIKQFVPAVLEDFR